MPKIFSKDAKITVVEYGEHACLTKEFETMKASMLCFLKSVLSK